MAEAIEKYFKYDVKEQSALLDKLQPAAAKLSALLNHLSGEGYDSFLSSEGNQQAFFGWHKGLRKRSITFRTDSWFQSPN